jgi:hypothetical protein
MLKKASKGDQLLRKKIDSVQLEHLMKKTNEEVGGGNISQPEVHAVQEGNQDQTTPHPYANAEWYLEECAALALALNDPYQGTKLKDLMNKWDQAQATEYIMKYINKYQVEQMVTMGAWSEKIVKRLWRSGGLL